MMEPRTYALIGGLDLTTPAIRTGPGRAIAGVNYECVERGYRRIEGFERLDGQTKPSQASYWLLSFDAGSAAFVEGETVTAASGGTGECLVSGVLESGAYGDSDAAGYLVLTNVSGAIADDDALTGSVSGAATAAGIPAQRGATDDATDTTWLRDAIETARTAIGAVPGSGPVRGVWSYDGDKYAFRDNAGATACVMHKATATGWVEQAFGRTLDFTSGGTSEIQEADTITGATSGATATVERVVVTSGAWASGDAAGYLVLSGQSGTFAAENLDVGGSANLATIAADSSAQTLPAGGSYRFVNDNFYGASNLRRMYFVNGVGRGHEWDGSVLVPIRTGMTLDTPTHLAVHRGHLFFAFPGGSLQHSGPGTPYIWSVVLGAGEIGIGQNITGLLADVSSVLTIFGRNKVAILEGASVADWNLRTLANDAGAIEDTAQKIGTPTYLDDRGLRTLDQTEQFGDFTLGTLTRDVEPLFAAKRRAGVTAVASCRVREKDQYLLFWSDGTGLSLYMGRSPAECMPFNLEKTVGCIASSEEADGSEVILFCSADASDAYVYELNAGTSRDGAELLAFLRLPFIHVGAPNQNKRWSSGYLELDGGPEASIAMLADFDYADPNGVPSVSSDFTVRGGGGFWNESSWGEFLWSAPVEGEAEVDLSGIGRNMSLNILSAATYEEPHTLHGLTVTFSPRRSRR